MNHKIERDGRSGHCVNEECTLNLTFLSDTDIVYLENNDQCPTGPLKKLMREPTAAEIVGDHRDVFKSLYQQRPRCGGEVKFEGHSLPCVLHPGHKSVCGSTLTELRKHRTKGQIACMRNGCGRND